MGKKLTETDSEIDLSGVIIEDSDTLSALVVVNYTIISGNQPVENKNWAGIWNKSDSDYWTLPPLGYAYAERNDTKQITIPLEKLDYGSYIVGYYTSDEATSPRGAPSATLDFIGSTTGTNPISCALKMLSYIDGELKIEYSTPHGNNPLRYDNAIAIWESDKAGWTCNWIDKRAITEADATGIITWTIQLKSETTYTLGYLNGTGCTNIAATFSFKTDQTLSLKNINPNSQNKNMTKLATLTNLAKLARETKLTVKSTTSTFVSTSVAGTFVVTDGSTGIFNISYATPSTNNPSKAPTAYKQFLYLWEVDSNSIYQVYNKAPLHLLPIDGTGSSGSKSFPSVERKLDKTYIAAYSYGSIDSNDDKVHPFAAMVVFNPGENTGTPITPTLSVPTIIGTSIYSSFITPEGNTPMSYGNWCGLAKGYGVTNDGSQVWLTSEQITTDNNAGTAFLDELLIVNQVYTLAYGYKCPGQAPSVGMYYIFTAVQS